MIPEAPGGVVLVVANGDGHLGCASVPAGPQSRQAVAHGRGDRIADADDVRIARFKHNAVGRLSDELAPFQPFENQGLPRSGPRNSNEAGRMVSDSGLLAADAALLAANVPLAGRSVKTAAKRSACRRMQRRVRDEIGFFDRAQVRHALDECLSARRRGSKARRIAKVQWSHRPTLSRSVLCSVNWQVKTAR